MWCKLYLSWFCFCFFSWRDLVVAVGWRNYGSQDGTICLGKHTYILDANYPPTERKRRDIRFANVGQRSGFFTQSLANVFLFLFFSVEQLHLNYRPTGGAASLEDLGICSHLCQFETPWQEKSSILLNWLTWEDKTLKVDKVVTKATRERYI